MVTSAASAEGVNLYATRGGKVLKVNYVANCAAPNSHLVNGTVSGLGTGKSVVLKNINNAETKVVNSNGVFSFNTSVASNQAYDVRVDSPPSGQVCTVANGSGTVGSKNIDDVLVTCGSSSPSSYTIGGAVSGLSGTVVLQNNSGDNLSITADGSFVFATPVTHGGSYSVTVLTQPMGGQTCTVTSGGSGTATGGMTGVVIDCAP